MAARVAYSEGDCHSNNDDPGHGASSLMTRRFIAIHAIFEPWRPRTVYPLRNRDTFLDPILGAGIWRADGLPAPILVSGGRRVRAYATW
jgi:hypothetical protein